MVSVYVYIHGTSPRKHPCVHFHVTWRINILVFLFPLRVCPATHCACRKRRLSCFGPPPQGEGVQICAPPPPPPPLRPPSNGGVPKVPKGTQRYPLSKPVVGQNIALCAVSATGLPNFCLPGSFNFIFHQMYPVLNSVECVLSSESEF